MEIKYQLFEEEYLLVQKFTGIFSIEYYQKFARNIFKKFESKTIKKVLIDFRDLILSELDDDLQDDFDDKINRITEIRKNINKNELKNRDVTLVIWVDKPLPTVIAHLFISNFSEMNYNYCSTTAEAIKILKTSLDFDLANIANNLENTFYPQ
jgi:hypothetical protein